MKAYIKVECTDEELATLERAIEILDELVDKVNGNIDKGVVYTLQDIVMLLEDSETTWEA